MLQLAGFRAGKIQTPQAEACATGLRMPFPRLHISGQLRLLPTAFRI
jgi:hypothetical protein